MYKFKPVNCAWTKTARAFLFSAFRFEAASVSRAALHSLHRGGLSFAALTAGRLVERMQARYQDARTLFDRSLARCNDVGLLAEEFDPVSGRMLGNFPQAYGHVGLINCAVSLSRLQGPTEERANQTSAEFR